MTLATDLDQLSIDTIRTLSIDGVQKANSGHPGAPMGAAPMAYALWTRFLRHAPTRPDWPDPDRFVLPPGPAPPPDGTGLARPRPVRPVGRSRVDAPVFAPPSDRLRRDARGPRELPAV